FSNSSSTDVPPVKSSPKLKLRVPISTSDATTIASISTAVTSRQRMKSMRVLAGMSFNGKSAMSLPAARAGGDRRECAPAAVEQRGHATRNGDRGEHRSEEIGRASCRERVQHSQE